MKSILALLEMVGIGIKKQGAIKKLKILKLEDVISHKWIVSYYFDNVMDQTSAFIGYVFIFDKVGSFSATSKGVEVHIGFWDLIANRNKLNIHIDSKEPLADLSDEWVIDNFTGNLIELSDDKLQSNEKLHFKRN